MKHLSVLCLGVLIASTVLLSQAFAADGKAVVPPAPVEPIAPFAGQESASVVLAGGCFWCTELAMERVKGVTDVVSGYAGGTEADADYRLVADGKTDHAEAIQITYDPQQITLGEIYRAFFLIHDPTQLNRQGPDVGRQYRSAVFYATDVERQAAESYLILLRESGLYPNKVATTLEPIGDGFFAAEDYHQDYVAKNPRDPYVVRYAYPKVEKLEKELPELVEGE